MEIDLELRRTNPSHTVLYVELLLGYTLKISQTRTWRGWELIRKLEVHSVELIYLWQRCFDASKPPVAASTRAQYQYVGFSRCNKILRCSAYAMG